MHQVASKNRDAFPHTERMEMGIEVYGTCGLGKLGDGGSLSHVKSRSLDLDWERLLAIQSRKG